MADRNTEIKLESDTEGGWFRDREKHRKANRIKTQSQRGRDEESGADTGETSSITFETQGLIEKFGAGMGGVVMTELQGGDGVI